MIRSFLSLIQNFIEVNEKESNIKSDMEYNEQMRQLKPNYNAHVQVLYEPTMKMNLHIEGGKSDIILNRSKSNRLYSSEDRALTETDLTHDKNRLQEKKVFYEGNRDMVVKQTLRRKLYRERDDDGTPAQELLEIPMSSRELNHRTSHTNLNKLFRTSRTPHPPLTDKEIRNIQKGESDHDAIMAEHVRKMKTGMQRLQEVAQKFSCTQHYKEDIEYLLKNVKSLAKEDAKTEEQMRTEYD